MSHPCHCPSLCIFIFIFILKICYGYSLNQSIPDCPSSTCGNLTISYPFWLSNEPSVPHYCGYRGFNISCNNQQQPIFHLPNHEGFYVKNISYTDFTITLVDMDSMGESCPRPRYNVTTLPNTLLPLLGYNALNLNLSFFFNCSSFNSSNGGEVVCMRNSNDREKSFVFREREIPVFEWNSNCEESVVVPVLDTGETMGQDLGRGDFERLLQNGFILEWDREDGSCRFCEDSEGCCGYSLNASKFLCYCPDGSHDFNCFNGDKKKHRDVIIGVVCAVFGSILIICAIICYIYRKRLISSSKLLSRALSSDSPLRSDLEKSNSILMTHFFEYKELGEATNNFDPSKELGDGGFGIVYQGQLHDGRNVAVKRLYENNCRCVEQFKNEIKILSQVRHQNLVTLYGCSSRHSRELLLVYEFIPNGTVADHLHGDRAKPGALIWPTRMSIAIETADALKYLHAVDIIHRDVKTNNILLDNNFHVKVADFGLSRLFPTNVTHISTAPQGTPGYVDPDYHRCYQLTDKSDVYSFGVVLIELISSKPAVDITRHRHEINLADMALDKIQNCALNELVDPTLEFDSNSGARRMITLVAELAFRCLQDEKENRPSMEEVLEQLRGIESEKYNVEKVEVNTVADEEALLTKALPLSPDNVTDGWKSTTTTANTSG